MKTFAYLGSSKEGGTYRVFEVLRDGLAPRGWEGHFVNEHCLPKAVIKSDEPTVLTALSDYLSTFDVVIGNVFVSVRLMNVLRFLPDETPRIMIVHSITRATYLAARALRDHVHHTVAVSPRIQDDLVRHHGFSGTRTSVVLNAVPDCLFHPPGAPSRVNKVGVLSLGRIEDRAKRVFLIPQMLKGIDPSLYHLTIAGDGPDRAELLRRLREAGISFDALGIVGRENLSSTYRDHEVFLLPSRFEGFGIAAAESMASGLVTIAASIPGVTSEFIEHGKSGFLFEKADVRTAAKYLNLLLKDPEKRLAMRQAAHDRAGELFHEASTINGYQLILESVLVAPPIAPKNLRRWRPPIGMGPGLRGLLPAKMRSRLADMLIYR